MKSEQDKRDLCEAVGWKLSNRCASAYSAPGDGRHPWDDTGDAIAALEAWRAKHGGSVFVTLSKPHKVDIFADGQFIGNSNGDTMPAAACRAILAAWRKMKATN